MTVPPAHRTLLLLAGLVAGGGGLFAVTDAADGIALGGARDAGLLLVAAILTRVGGRAWVIATVGALGGMVVALLSGLRHIEVAIFWPQVDGSMERALAIGGSAMVALFCGLGAIAVWRGLPRDDSTPEVPGTTEGAFFAHGRRLMTGVGAMVLAAGFCAVKATTLPQMAVASLSQPESSPLLDNPAVQQVITDPRILRRLRDEPDFRQKVKRLGVPSELIAYTLQSAPPGHRILPEPRRGSSSMHIQPWTGRSFTHADLVPAPPRAEAQDRSDQPGPPATQIGDQTLMTQAPMEARIVTERPIGRVVVPDLQPSPVPVVVADPPEVTDGDPLPTAAPARSDAGVAGTVITTILGDADRGQTLVDTAVERTDLWGTVAMALGAVTMIVGISLGWWPLRS